MNNKWLKLGTIAMLVAVAGALALGATAFAQGPAGNPPAGVGVGYGLGGGRGGAWGGPDSSLVAVAANVLGMDQAELVAALNSGQTIADVAKAKGVALDKIVDAFIAPRVDALNQAVADGRLTQAQADTMLATMKANFTAQVSAPHAVTPRGASGGMSFVDADGDGVCDNLGAQQPRSPRG
ncbi:MAG: hypothetical protein AAB217_03835, partial [Chloroflexota bacterium]